MQMVMGKILVYIVHDAPGCSYPAQTVNLTQQTFPLFPWAKSFLMLVVSLNNLTSSQLFLK